MICVVQFPNGKYGVRKSSWFERPKFYAKDREWWSLPEHVSKYCHFETIQEAEELAVSMMLSCKKIKCFGWWNS